VTRWRPSLRFRFFAYLFFIHLLFAGVVGYLLRGSWAWLLVIEFVTVLTFAIGVWLMRRVLGSLAFMRESATLLNESDFMSRFRDVGQPELDQLIHVYNRMVDNMRDERVRLQEQQFLLSRILDVSPSGIVTLDFEQKVTYVNPAASRLLDQPSAAIVGRPLGDFDAPLATEVAKLEAGKTHVVPLWGGRRVRVHRGAFLDRGFQRSFVLFEELTEELRQAEKAAYEKLIRMLSHEVNNSVAASNSLLHSCLNYGRSLGPEEREDFEAALGIVIARTEQLNRFMRSFADVVRLPPPARQPVDLVDLVRGIARLLRAETDERRILVQWDVQNGLGPVSVDRTQIEQVLVNIFRNAIDAIGRDGTITVRVGRRGARPAIVVEDTGPGIPPDVRPHLFTPFFSTKEQGQGIGLTLVQEILSQHQIEYSLDSLPGEPTRFTMLF